MSFSMEIQIWWKQRFLWFLFWSSLILLHCADCEGRLLRDQDREKDYNHRRRWCGPTSGEEYYIKTMQHTVCCMLKGIQSQCDIFMTMRWRLLSPGPRHGDPRGQAAAPRHAGHKSSGYQGNRVSHWGAAAESTGMWLLGWWRCDLSYMKTPLHSTEQTYWAQRESTDPWVRCAV